MDTASVTAAPIELQIGDHTYRFSLLTDAILGRLERFMQDRFVNETKRHLDDLDAKTKADVMVATLAEARKIRLGSPAFSELLGDVDVVVCLSRMLLEKHHPKIQPDQIRELMFGGHAAEIGEAIERAMAGGVLGKLMQAQTESTAPSTTLPLSETNCMPASQ